MPQPGSAQLCRQRISELVRLAVPEPDDERRQALMVMADHWSELLRLRTRADGNDPGGSLSCR